jgi:hypothetical protein
MGKQRAYRPFLLVHWIVCLTQNRLHFESYTRHHRRRFTIVSYSYNMVSSLMALSFYLTLFHCMIVLFICSYSNSTI